MLSLWRQVNSEYWEHKDMTDEKNTNIPAPEGQTTSESAAPSAPSGYTGPGKWLALLSLILAIGAWVMLSASGYTALGIAALAVVAGMIDVCRFHGPWRTVSVTGIIAGAVLIVVVTAFIMVMKIGLR